jgi:hypothetical protein
MDSYLDRLTKAQMDSMTAHNKKNSCILKNRLTASYQVYDRLIGVVAIYFSMFRLFNFMETRIVDENTALKAAAAAREETSYPSSASASSFSGIGAMAPFSNFSDECEYQATFGSLSDDLEIRRVVIPPVVAIPGANGLTPSVIFLDPQSNINSTTPSVIVHIAGTGEYAYLFK